MPPELKILYVWTSKYTTLIGAKNIKSIAEATITSSVVVLNGRIVKCPYTTVHGKRWTSPKDYIKKHNLAPCNPVIERIEVF